MPFLHLLISMRIFSFSFLLFPPLAEKLVDTYEDRSGGFGAFWQSCRDSPLPVPGSSG